MRKIGQIFGFLIPVIALAALVVFLAGAGKQKMTKKAFKAAYDQMVEAWNTGNVDAIDEFMAPDCVTHEAPNPDMEGREAYKKYIRDTRSAFPEIQITEDEYILDGNIGATQWTFRATQKDTGKQVAIKGACVTKWEDGKCVEHWVYSDPLGFMLQLGFKLVPPEK